MNIEHLKQEKEIRSSIKSVFNKFFFFFAYFTPKN